MIPVAQPHGQVQEVTAPNVEPEDVLFSKTSLEEMDAACGPQQSLSAIRMSTGAQAEADEKQKVSWKKRSQERAQATALPNDDGQRKAEALAQGRFYKK